MGTKGCWRNESGRRHKHKAPCPGDGSQHLATPPGSSHLLTSPRDGDCREAPRPRCGSGKEHEAATCPVDKQGLWSQAGRQGPLSLHPSSAGLQQEAWAVHPPEMGHGPWAVLTGAGCSCRDCGAKGARDGSHRWTRPPPLQDAPAEQDSALPTSCTQPRARLPALGQVACALYCQGVQEMGSRHKAEVWGAALAPERGFSSAKGTAQRHDLLSHRGTPCPRPAPLLLPGAVRCHPGSSHVSEVEEVTPSPEDQGRGISGDRCDRHLGVPALSNRGLTTPAWPCLVQRVLETCLSPARAHGERQGLQAFLSNSNGGAGEAGPAAPRCRTKPNRGIPGPEAPRQALTPPQQSQ